MNLCVSHILVCPKKPIVIFFFSFSFLLFVNIFEAKAQAPTVTSFSPTTVCPGDEITITGTNFTGATTVQLGSVAATNFTVVDAATITATVNLLATDGPVSVATPGGTGTAPGTLTIKPAPIPLLTDAVAIDAFTNCNGNATYQLTVRNSSSNIIGNNTYKIDWGDNSAAFTQVNWALGATTSHTYSAQGYFSITLTIAPDNGCTKSVTVQFYNGVNPIASFTTSTSTTGLCAPAPIQFQLGNWFNNSTGTTYQVSFGDGSPNVTLSHPLNATNTIQLLSHTYTTSSCPNIDYTATLQAKNGCFTTTYTLNQIIIRKKPTADFTFLPSPACVNTPVCFTNTTTNGFSGSNSCITTSIFTWDFGDGTPVSNLITPACHTYATPGTYMVTLSASNPTCGNDTKTKTIVVLATSPVPLVTTPVIYCRGQAAVPLTATGTGLLWYTSATGGTGTITAPTPSTATAGSTTWYVSQTIASSCESPRVPITVTVNALPTAPLVTTPVQLCLNQTTTPLIATGTGLLWYTIPAGGTGSATAPTPTTTATGTTTYYVSQTTNTCEGPRAAINVIVNPLAVAPTVTPVIIYCQNQPSIPLTATPTNGLLWYTVATGGTGSSIAPTPSTSVVGSTTWYVSQLTGCGEGPRSSITVTVNPGPSATIAYNPSIVCNVNKTVSPNPPIDVTLTGTAGGTYSITPATGLFINATTGQVDPSGATAGTYTIKYSIPASGGCATFSTIASVIINGTPAATITYPAAICTSTPSTNVQLTGTQGGIFSSTTGLTINAVTGAITPGTSTPGLYTVTYTIAASGPCPGLIITRDVTITQAPSASIAYSVINLCNVTDGATTPNPSIAALLTGTAGGTYSIIPVAGLLINSATGTITPSGATAGTYTVHYTIPGAGGCPDYVAAATVSVSGAPTATIKYPSPVCSSDSFAIVARTGTAGGTYTSITGLVINSSTGAVAPASSIPGKYIITYTIAPSAPCPGFVTTDSIVITKAPLATIQYNPASLCNVVNSLQTPNPAVAVVQTGTLGGTYSIIPATGLPIDAATGTIIPSGATPGSYSITYHIPAAGGCANYNVTTAVTISSASAATIIYPASPYCRGTSTLQPVTFSGTGGGLYSSVAGLSINATTGAINPSLSLPGVYTITYTIAPSAPCPGYIATTSVQIDDSPVLTFPLPAQSVCSGGTASYLPSSTVANTTYAWALVGPLPAGLSGIGSGTASGPNASISLTFTNTTAISQTITVQVKPTNPSQNPCPGVPYNITLTVNPIPVAPVADTFHFCMATPATALSVIPLTGNTIKWYDSNFGVLNAAPFINTASPASFTYYVSQSNVYGCESPKTKVIAIVHPTAKIVSSAFTNPVTCGIPSGSVVLNVLDLNNNPIPNIPLIVHYTKFQTTHQVLGSTDANGKITVPLTAGTYSGFYIETYGCLSQMIPDVFILKDPNPPAQPVAGYNPPICSETQLNLTALTPTSTQLGAINYVWAGPAFGPLPDTTQNTVVSFPSASVAFGGTYVVYAIQNNCISPTATFQVVIKESPSKPIISTRAPLCVGDDLVLQAFSSVSGQNAQLNYSWSGPGTGFPVNTANAGISKVKIQDAGIYTITVTSPQTGCSSTADTLILIGNYPIVKFARDTFTLPTGYLLQLIPAITNAADPGILPMKNFAWTPASDLACNDPVCSSPVATIKNNVCYSVKATNIYGCSGSDTVCIKVFCQGSQVFIPNAFTPAGNVVENNKLMVRASGISSVKSFRVFNRWGRIMFERNNFPPNSTNFGWDGRVNGKLADTGVYIYTVEVICENGIPYSYKGNVTLL